MKESDVIPFTVEDTVELYSKSKVNFIYMQSRFLVNAQQLAKDPEVGAAAKKAIVTAAESMMLAASELYCRLSQAYKLE